jgi:hypothetical protein
MDISRILQTAFKSYLRAAWFAVPIGCEGGRMLHASEVHTRKVLLYDILS